MATKLSLIAYWIVIEWPLKDTWIDHWKVIKKVKVLSQEIVTDKSLKKVIDRLRYWNVT